MKKLLYILLVSLLVVSPLQAKPVKGFQMSFVDEFGKPVTSITSITVFNAGLSSSPTIYADKGAALTMVNPITTSSTNSTFDQSVGLVKWFQTEPDFKLTVTDGTKTLTVDNMNESNTRFAWYDNYIGTAASLSVNDNQSITVGTDLDMVLAWNNGSSFMSWIPASDGSAFNLGTSGTSKNVDFNWFVGTALGIKASESGATLVIDGVTTSINTDSNFATNINTGTSTGAVTIGGTASGTLALDTDSGITINADDSIAATVSAGTIGLGATGGDITIDGVDSSVIIRGTEEAADAVLIDADGTAGGVHVDCGTGDITLDSGDDIFLAADTGTGDVISAIVTQGTSTSSMVLQSVAGGINVDAELEIAINVAAAGSNLVLGSTLGSVYITAEEDAANAVLVTADASTASGIILNNITGTGDESIFIDTDLGGITVNANAGSVDIEAVGGTDGDIGINAGDDITITAAGKVTITNTEPVTISGTLTPVAVNIVDFVVTDQASVTLTAAMSGKILVIANLAQDTTIDLPAEVNGLNFEFWYVGAAVETHDHIIDAEANANFYIGGLHFIDSDDDTHTPVYGNGSTESKLTLHNMEAGTRVKITCDGTNWYITGTVYSDTAPAFAVSV